ncbi:ABC transporter ATP-binding protein, partial [Oceanidesulfovibrio marinus]
MLLEIENLKVRYGTIEALHGISFSVDKGEIVALLGANG